MTLNLPHLIALDAKRTKGPWQFRDGFCYQLNEEFDDALWTANPSHHDARFIEALVNSWPALLARLEAAEGCAQRLEEIYSQLPGVKDVDERIKAWRRLVGDQT